MCAASNTAAAAAADVPVRGCTAAGARVGAGAKVGSVGREREGNLRSGMLMDTAGKEETEEDRRLKNDSDAAGAGATLDVIMDAGAAVKSTRGLRWGAEGRVRSEQG